MTTLRRLPGLTVSREGRDTLWLLAVLSLCIAPHMSRLPLWCSLGASAAVLWRANLAWRDAALPPRWVMVGCLTASVVMTLCTFHSLLGREAGITLVTLLAGLKTLELRARRDAFVITSLGFFLILTQFLSSQSPFIAALMSVALLGLLSSLVLAQRPLGRPTIMSAVGSALRAVAWGLPLMLALYLLFPRIGPIWALPSDANARTGLSDELTLGRVAELAMDDGIAMRLRFSGSPPQPQRLYFRGPVLDQFDGRQWTARPDAKAPDQTDEIRLDGAQVKWIEYDATLEPSTLSALPLLEGTLAAQLSKGQSGPQLIRQGLDWRSSSPQQERLSLHAKAASPIQHGPIASSVALRQWVELPAGYNPRTLAWAMALARRPDLRQADARMLANEVLKHIRHEKFSYTLSPGDDAVDAKGQTERHLIDRFWMDRRSGFCEHFATAFVVVMRAMDVPSRVVTGFQGAEINSVDGLYVVRNSDAHAWAEFWQAGEGWVRADPTAAIAPERIDRARPLVRRPDTASGRLAQMAPAWMSRVRAAMDAANHRWNTWVLAYSRDSQLELMRDWGWEAPSGTDLMRLCMLVLVSLSLAGAAWLWWTRPRQRPSPWTRPLWRIHRALTQAGMRPPTGCPAPAPALAWSREMLQQQHLTANEQETMRLTKDIKDMIEALSQLDALCYGPDAENATPATVRQLTTQIEQLARRGRKLKARQGVGHTKG
jgi:transglutaminase-like putative cysteine protease